MPTPPSAPRLPGLLSLAALLAPWAATLAEADDIKGERQQVIRSAVPRYDPALHDKLAAEKAARDERVKAAIARAEQKPEPAPPPAAPGSNPDVLELPKVTVHATPETPKRLPRVDAAKPLREIQAEPFESPSARHDRIMRKHLSSFGRALAKIPFLGMGVAGSAYEAEAAEQRAAQLNGFADAIEIQAALGRDPAEIKQLREEYKRLYYAGPKK